MTSFESQMIFSRLPTCATLRGMGEFGKIWILFSPLVFVQRIRLNCSGFNNGSANKKRGGEEVNDSNGDIKFSGDI